MNYHSSKHNTLNNIENIEELAINYETPEDIIIAREENKKPKDIDRKKLIELVLKLDVLDTLDIEVIMGFTTRRQAAAILNIRYDAYRKRLQRKLKFLEDAVSEI